MNVIVVTYNDGKLSDIQVGTTAGTVAFGSGLHQPMDLYIEAIRQYYGAKSNVLEEKMMSKLLGDW